MPTTSAGVVVCLLAAVTCSALTLPDRTTLPSYEFTAVGSRFAVNATTVFAGGYSDLFGASNRIVFVAVDVAAVDVLGWANECYRQQCAALAFYTASETLLQVSLELVAFQFVSSAPLPVPVVVLGQDESPNINWIREHPDAFVSITSGGFANPSGAALTSWPTRLIWGLTSASYAGTVFAAVLKVLTFGIDHDGHLRRIPFLSMLTLSCVIIQSVFGLVNFANVAFCSGQGLTYPALIYFTYADYAYNSLGRLGIGFATMQANRAGSVSASQTWLQRGYVLSTSLLILATMVVPMVFAALGTVPMGIVGVCVLFTVPSAIFSAMNSRSVGALLRTLRAGGANLGLSPEETKTRMQFMRRLAMAVLCGYLILFFQILFLAVQNLSPWAYLVVRALEKLSSSVQALYGVTLLRAKPSLLDNYRILGVASRKYAVVKDKQTTNMSKDDHKTAMGKSRVIAVATRHGQTQTPP
ncbi:Membrane-associated protein [Plasmodiophora brassicae]